MDEQGEPVYSVSLMVLGPGSAQTLTVNAAGELSPGARQKELVKVSGLVASPSWGGTGIVFTAARIEGANGCPERS